MHLIKVLQATPDKTVDGSLEAVVRLRGRIDRAVFTKLQQIRHKRKMIVGRRVPELEHRPVRETCSVSPHELRVRLHLRVFTRQQIG